MVIVARPRFDEDGTEVYFRKKWNLPFCDKGTNKNQVARTLLTKPARIYLNGKGFKEVRSKWPPSNTPTFIQQDNARPHLSGNELEAAQQDNFDVRYAINLLPIQFLIFWSSIFLKLINPLGTKWLI